MTLQERFPRLSFAKTADEFIASCGDNLMEELRSRRIAAVRIVPLFSNAGLGIDENGDFFVKIDDVSTDVEQAEGLGHEIGHTFHHDLSVTPVQNFLPEELYGEIEEFCNAFSLLWIEKHGLENLTKRFENQSALYSVVAGTGLR